MSANSPLSTYSIPSTISAPTDNTQSEYNITDTTDIDRLPQHVIDHHIQQHNTPKQSCCEHHSSYHNNDSLLSSLSLDGELNPSPMHRQRSGYADVTHLMKQKLQRSTSILPWTYSTQQHTFTPKPIQSTDRSQTVDHDVSMLPAPSRQQSSYELMKNKLSRYISGSNTTNDECIKCQARQPCAVHNDKTKSNALLSLKQHGAHRQLLQTPSNQNRINYSIGEKRV